MAFLETPRFPDDISYGATIGPEWKTHIVETASGHEQRNQDWSTARWRADVSHGVKKQTQLDALVAFFRAVRGRAHAFRVKDWSDFHATVANGLLGTGIGTGLPAYQLGKLYVAGALSELRTIRKPVAGRVAVYRNAVAAIAGAGAGQYALDATTGIVTWVADASAAVTGHTPGASHVLTTAGDITGLGIGGKLHLFGVTGTAAGTLNGLAHTISNKTGAGPFTWTLSIATTGLSASGGTAAKYPQAADALTWSGEFDVPCRFDTDRLEAEILTRQPDGTLVLSWTGVPIIEIRT